MTMRRGRYEDRCTASTGAPDSIRHVDRTGRTIERKRGVVRAQRIGSGRLGALPAQVAAANLIGVGAGCESVAASQLVSEVGCVKKLSAAF
jgi:hypothetical protein